MERAIGRLLTGRIEVVKRFASTASSEVALASVRREVDSVAPASESDQTELRAVSFA